MFNVRYKKSNNFNAIAVSIASPDEIELWSHGEVTKPETINYRTQKPEMDGLFCERIFGPTKNWECFCGKYKRIRYQGVVCEKCGVEVTRSIVRRERMGHISLAVPITHIWFLRSTPSRIGLLLNLPIKTLEQVIYFAAYMIIEVDEKIKKESIDQLHEDFSNYKKKEQQEYQKKQSKIHLQKLSKEARGEEMEKLEQDHAKKLDSLKQSHDDALKDLERIEVGQVLSEFEYRNMNMKFGHVFRAGTGAEAIKEIISRIDLDKMMDKLKNEGRKTSSQKQKKIIKRIKFIASLQRAGIRPEWMIMTKLPVIPPDLRPMVQLDGGRFAASDLNDLYRRVINRNNRLKKLIAIGAPEVICRNEKRMLQEAVDTLLNNSARSGKAVFTAGDRRKLRSLSDMLKGKQGRFRQNLLGKRVDYSGRSVIVVGPNLKLHQCGIPKEMALKLFKPFIIGELIRQDYAYNVKGAERIIQAGKKEVWDILERVIQGRYVLLNRAPTLHRLGIQAFQPVLIEGKAIQIHPLVCAAFNADFDGDQMAVHLPLSSAAQRESKEFMLSSRNLLKPSAGEPIITPTQDMVLGCYFLTITHEGKKGEGAAFATISEAINAYRLGYVDLQAKIRARVKNEILKTSVGRLIFNSFLPEELGFYNQTIRKKDLSAIIARGIEECPAEKVAVLADSFKRIGFKFATKSGISISAYDMEIPPEKDKIIEEADEVIKKINNLYWKGWLTANEKYNHSIRIWAEAKSKITNFMVKQFSKKDENDILYMIDSGARGNWGQITQLCGIKGLVANPSGRTIELPIKSNLKEGFTILEYFIATHGGRKGKSDTSLKTAEAGYLTRRLVDAVQDIIIRVEDCGTTEKHTVTRVESEMIGEDFENRVFGRTLAEDLLHPKTKEILAKKGDQIDNALTYKIKEFAVEELKVRSIITCEVENGICQKCYGRDLGSNKTVKIGTPVGIIAAQSIGEPGTQLTMRTFHMGGAAEGSDITQGLTRVEELFEARPPKALAQLCEVNGKITEINVNEKNQKEVIIVCDGVSNDEYKTLPCFEPYVKVGDKVSEKQVLAKSIIDRDAIRAKNYGKVIEVSDNQIVINHEAKTEKKYVFGTTTILSVDVGDRVIRGQALNKGHFNLHELMDLTNAYEVQKYIITEVQSIYASQGQTINDKHIEIIAKKMLSKIRVVEPGDSELLPSEIVDNIRFAKINKELAKKKKNQAYGEQLLLGLTRTSLLTDSWLAAASFQETIRVLVDASTTKKIDNLRGLKENVIIGKLIPVGEIYRRRYGYGEEEN